MKIDIRKLEAKETKLNAEESRRKQFWSFLNTDIRFRRNHISEKVKESFYLELSTLLGAGIDMRNALQMILDDIKNAATKKLFYGVYESVLSGSTLSQAMKDSRCFTAYEYYSIQIGEETGEIIEVLKQLSLYFEVKIKQRRQVINSLSYPLFILLISTGAIFFMIGYVVPLFTDVFRRFGNDLPGITKAVITLSEWMQTWGMFMILLPAATAVVLYIQRENNQVRKVTSKILLRIPFVGNIMRRIYLARFANTMSLLMSSNVPVLYSLELTRKMIRFYPLEEALSDIEEKILSGNPLHRSMERHAIFYPKMVALTKVGEEVNQLGPFFKKIADQYTKEVDHLSSVLGKLMEPVIIVVLGVITGVVLIALYLPLFKLGDAFQ